MADFVCPVPDCGKPSWDDVEVGDTVVVEYRGVASNPTHGGHLYEPGGIYFGNRHRGADSGFTLKSVEKKPARTFKPGDVVRWTDHPPEVYTIGEGRYYSHLDRAWFDFSGDFTEFSTADGYELVD